MAKKKKVLVCDDEEGIRESFKLILGETYDLMLASSGRECLEALEKHKDIKVVLLDIKMPKQSGLEVVAEIKRLYPHTHVIMVTGYECAEIAQEAHALGADDYIVKPFDKKIISEKVASYL